MDRSWSVEHYTPTWTSNNPKNVAERLIKNRINGHLAWVFGVITIPLTSLAVTLAFSSGAHGGSFSAIMVLGAMLTLATFFVTGVVGLFNLKSFQFSFGMALSSILIIVTIALQGIFYSASAVALAIGAIFAILAAAFSFSTCREILQNWRVQRKIRNYQPFSDQEFLSNKVWGEVGQVSRAKHFAAHNKELGVIGEKNTEELVQHLLTTPGTRVFHCLRFPAASTEADIDHVVVNGNKVAVIDSKNYQGAHYSWNGNDKIRRARTDENGKKSNRSYVTHFPFAVKELQAKHFRPATVRGWVTIYSNDGVEVTTTNGKAQRIRLATPQQTIEEIGRWFLEDASEVGAIDIYLMRAIHANLK